MKKLIAIGLMLLSPLTFAKDFNPNLLIGTWQCGEVSENNAKGEVMFIDFFKEHLFFIETQMIIKSMNGKLFAVPVINSIGKWRIKDNSLEMSIEQITYDRIKNIDIHNPQQLQALFTKADNFKNVGKLDIRQDNLFAENATNSAIPECRRIKN